MVDSKTSMCTMMGTADKQTLHLLLVQVLVRVHVSIPQLLVLFLEFTTRERTGLGLGLELDFVKHALLSLFLDV